MMAKADRLLGRHQVCWIYLIELPPYRFKIGRTKDPEVVDRLEAVKRGDQAARLVRAWPAMVSWEEVARAWIEAHFELVPLGHETYIGQPNQIEAIKESLDSLFERLPSVDDRIGLSEEESKVWKLRGEVE